MPPWVMDEWEAHYALRPWGGAADDERLAFQLMNLVQAATGGKLRMPGASDPEREPWQLKDFLLHQLPEERRQRRWEFQPADPAAYLRRLDATWAARGWARDQGREE